MEKFKVEEGTVQDAARDEQVIPLLEKDYHVTAISTDGFAFRSRV